jgi:predicted CXXCH cytochrome family protein
MRASRRIRAVLLAAATLAGMTNGRADAATDAGICARCHDAPATLAAGAGGHAAALDCMTCHEDRRPGVFGRHHRTIPTSCTSHHRATVQTHPVRELGPARLRRSCLKCHDPHGSTNAHLIRTSIRIRGRLRPVDFVAAAGGSSPSFVDAARPGHGLCEICHQDTRFYPASGHGEPHFMGDCALCHDHAAGFGPVADDANCAACHPSEDTALATPTLHHDRFAGKCSSCHAEVNPDPGPGHRATSACADCHSPARVATHVPPGQSLPCTQCHDAHGSDNIRLVRDVIHTTTGVDRPMLFRNLSGKADGSFVSASAPGTGLCEVCHRRTQFYRADGGGAAHYTTECGVCHLHAAGFAPR